jgi:polo-like kinase 4
MTKTFSCYRNQLVMYNENAKYTLMSNVPQADIEIIHPCSPPSVHQKARRITDSAANEESLAPRMRIRLSRYRHSAEIARLWPSQSMGEWTKKVFNAVDGKTGIQEADWKALDDTERAGMEGLQQFVHICEAVEGLSEETLHREAAIETSNPKGKIGGGVDSDLSPQARGNALTVSSSVTTKGPLAFTVAPRPMKLSSILSRCNGSHATRDQGSKWNSTLQQQIGSIDRPQCSRDEFSDELNQAAGIQTRFLPSSGWCIRYGSRVSQGGRYRIMFLDGITLDVDVDEEYVEFTSRSGDVTRQVDL